jgi:protein-tyrosine phosphatase
MVTPVERHVDLESCANFRDLGGYTTTDGRMVRWRRLFRADSLHRLTDTDLEVARDLGLRTVIDLRSHGELKRVGRYPVDRHEVTHHHLPVFATLREMGEQLQTFPADAPPGQIYVVMAAMGPEALATALGLLADPDTYPAVFHCTAGKDRTGILAALVLSVLGVPNDTIVADYALTQLALDRMRTANTPAVDGVEREPEADEPARGQFDTFPAGAQNASAEEMAGFLDLLVQRHGSVEGYLVSIGVGDEVLAGLSDLLLD